MSSFSSPPSLAIPSTFRRKSSSASTSYSIDSYNYGLGEPASSSPLLSSPPLLTPLHLARPYEYAEWRTSDHPGAIYDPRDKSDNVRHPGSRHISSTRRVLPSLITKFATPALWGDAPLSYSPSPFSSAPQTTHLFPKGDSAISDDCEEHDLESMNIHVRETYFAISAERGRWLSSPIAPRIRSRATPPPHVLSSPIKPPADMSPLGERLRAKSCTIDEQLLTSLPEEHDQDMHHTSSLPPSSPLSSPLSYLSFLGDDCEDNAIVDHCSNSDDSSFFGATPELSSACTSPAESAHTSILHKAPTITSPLFPPHPQSYLPDSCHLNRRNRSPIPVDADTHAPGPSGVEMHDVLSPLSQFELDLPEPDPLKLPLSGMENKFYPGQHVATPGVNVDSIRTHDGSSPVQFPSMKSNDEPLDVSPHTLAENSKKNVKKRKADATADSGARERKRRAVVRSASPCPDEKKKRGVENHTSNNSEPPRKRSRLSRCRDDYGGKARRKRDGTSKVERRGQSPSLPAVDRCDSSSERLSQDDKSSKVGTTSVPEDDAEFHGPLTGMLIEAFATSRATSMDSAALYVAVTQAHPYLAVERSKQRLSMDIVAVLEAGRARCGMFEKVDCSGERTRHKTLESRWFYVPERDEDSERASLISAIMPRQKRNETKKYKQYYYRPLDKISRWDPEDAP